MILAVANAIIGPTASWMPVGRPHLKTHTGALIEDDNGTLWIRNVGIRKSQLHKPGRAKQMRRMVRKAMRRSRKEVTP